MDGIIIIDKPKNYTSRDVVNIVAKTFKTKKVGHTGTLDPLATGVLVICINRATKLVELLTSLDKEYIAEFEFGTLTDTLDITGNILKDEKVIFAKEEIEEVLNSMIGKYNQTVPIYSAIKVNGKKLYEYARNNEQVELPVHEVEIFDLELLDIYEKNNKTNIKVRCHVSKGTYIRSLGNDIAAKLNTNAIMTSLRRTKQGKFSLKDAISLEELTNKTNIMSISECLNDFFTIVADLKQQEYIKNGRELENIYNREYVLFVDENNNALALYQSVETTKLKPFKMFQIK